MRQDEGPPAGGLREGAPSAALCEVLAECAPDVMFHVVDDVVTWVSTGVRDLLGWTPQEVVGMSVPAVVHPDDKVALADLRAHLDSDGAASGIIRVRTQSQGFVWVEVSLRRGPGQPTGFTALGSARSAQEHAQLRAALAESQERFRLAMENAPIGMCLVAPSGGFIAVNGALCQFLDRDAAALCEATWQDVTHPDDLAVDLSHVRDVTTGLVDAYRMRKRYLRADGTVVWGDLSVGCVRNADRSVRYFVSQILDITDRVVIENDLAQSERRFRLLAENISDVVAHVVDGRIAYISPSITTAMGGTPDQWVGLPIISLVHPDDLNRLPTDMGAFADAPAVLGRLRIRDQSGTYHWVSSNTRAYRDETGRVNGLIASMRIVDKLVAAETELDHQARFDALTGLANRKEVLQRISRINARGRRSGEETAVLFCDIDDFKDINDMYGHEAGDEVLRTLGERLSGALRTDDTAARIGGDEILVVLTGVHTLEEATAVAEKLRQLANTPIGFTRGRAAPSLSIGVTLARIGEDMDTLIARADRAMYQAKRTGKNRVVAVTV